MKTKLILLCGAVFAALSLSSCDIYGYPGYGGYGGYGRSYYNNNHCSRPLLGLGGPGNFYGGYSRPYGYSGYNRGYSSPFSSFGNIGYNRSCYSSPFLGRTNLSTFGGGFGGSPFGNRGFASSPFGGFGGGHSFGGFGGGRSFFGGHHH